ILLALLLIPILLVKILIARYYKQYSAALLPLGVTIFALSFALVSMNLVPYLLGRAGSEGAPASVSSGFLLTVCLGLGFLLLHRPRPTTGAVSSEASRHPVPALTAAPSQAQIGRATPTRTRLQL